MAVQRKGRRRQGPKKRRQGEDAFVALEHWMLDSPAFLALSGNEVRMVLRLARYFHGTNNGKISYSYRQAQADLGMGSATVQRVLASLERKGFIVCEQRGKLTGGHFASVWRLTWLPTIAANGASTDRATKDFMGAAKIAGPLSERKRDASTAKAPALAVVRNAA